MRVVRTRRPRGVLPAAFQQPERRCGHVPDRFRASRGQLTTPSAGGAPGQGRARMTARLRSVTFDCTNPYRLAGFWSQVTGYQQDPDNHNQPADPEALLVAPDGQPNLLFSRVPATRRWPGCSGWAPRWWPTTVGPMAPVGPCSPIQRATSCVSSAAPQSGRQVGPPSADQPDGQRAARPHRAAVRQLHASFANAPARMLASAAPHSWTWRSSEKDLEPLGGLTTGISP